MDDDDARQMSMWRRRYACRRCGYQWEHPDPYPVPETCPRCRRDDALSEARLIAG